MSGRIRVYLGCSLDGFISGPNHDLDWLHEHPAPTGETAALEFGEFIEQVGVLLMGRSTYDVIAAFDDWPYGELPVLVATHRPMVAKAPSVQAVSGDIVTLVNQARKVACGKDVYLDGGTLTQQALNAGLVDELTLTMLPILLGEGTRLFEGLISRSKLSFREVHRYGPAMVQITADVVA